MPDLGDNSDIEPVLDRIEFIDRDGTPMAPPPAPLADACDQSAGGVSQADFRKALPMILQALRPLVMGIEALGRATEENTKAVADLHRRAEAQEGIPRLMETVVEKIDSTSKVSQSLFDALHTELREYKDGFMLETLQKPIIRDLLSLYDDLEEVRRQLGGCVDGFRAGALDPAAAATVLDRTSTNLQHTIELLLELLERLEVRRVAPILGKLDKKWQRAVDVEMAPDAASDGDVVASLKPGFMWRERLFRPEEVIIRKWKDGYLVAMPMAGQRAPREPNQ